MIQHFLDSRNVLSLLVLILEYKNVSIIDTLRWLLLLLDKNRATQREPHY